MLVISGPTFTGNLTYHCLSLALVSNVSSNLLFLYSLCQPDDNYEYCTDDQDWQDGRMSFPSGHASYAFCALTLLHLYLEQCLGFGSVASQFVVVENGSKQFVYQRPENALRYRVISILCLAPIALAIFIACSRVVDNKHFPADVVAGSVLGASIARYFHFLWYVL